MKLEDAKRLVAESGAMLLREGLAARTWGNISCLADGGVMAITPSGLGYEIMSEDDIVAINLATGERTGKYKPSSEKGVHASAYRQFKDAGFVLHTHQVYASAFCLSGTDTLALSMEESKALGSVALAGYGLPGTKKLARNISGAFATGAHVVLMANHGAVIVGKDREEAFSRALLLEKLCFRACKGQPSDVPAVDENAAQRLLEAATKIFGHAACVSTPPVLACASSGKAISAQLDDMAQMIGAKLKVVQPEEKAVTDALNKKDAILVPGVGAICRASTKEDIKALCLLIKKSCICHLHTNALGASGRLSAFDAVLMRAVYLKKYSKKIGG